MATSSRYSYYFMLFWLSILMTPTDLYCGQWSSGCGISFTPECGNLTLRSPAVDFEAFIGYENCAGCEWWLILNRFIPLLQSDTTDNTLHVASIWAVRGAKLRLPWLSPRITAGLGFCFVERKQMNENSEFGTLGFRITLSLPWRISEKYIVESALRFQGAPLGISGEYTDRLGVALSIIRRL